MKFSGLVVATVGLSALAVLANGCSGDCDISNTCNGAVAAGGDGGDGAVAEGGLDAPVVEPLGCVAEADPKEAPACVDNRYAVFVSAFGNDGNPGTKEQPVKTIGVGLSLRAGRPRMYVCEGTYAERLTLTSGVTLVGGFGCNGWTYSGAKAKVAPKEAGPALELSNATGVTVSDVAFEAVAGTAASRSSIVAFAHGSTGQLLRVELVAREGKDGASAASGSNFDALLLASNILLRGRDGVTTAGAAQQDCLSLCTNNEHSTGGKGGNGGGAPTNGDPGKPDRGAGVGGLANVCNPTLQNGNAGALGEDGVAALSVGTLTEQGWSPSNGEAAKAGGPGQGGGGGGGGTDPGNTVGAGGGGGCGGCGGSAGSVAEGGGASIALVSLSSTLTLTNATLIATNAGHGGAGAPGQPGQVGGTGGIQTSGGCPGGRGGVGGGGGASGGGAGGVSAGVVFKGTKPTLQASPTPRTGTKGDKGTGGKPGVNDGPDGVTSDLVEVP